jgi:hypothetical protein
VELCSGSLANIQNRAGSVFNLALSVESRLSPPPPAAESHAAGSKRRRRARPPAVNNAKRPLLMKSSSPVALQPSSVPQMILLMPLSNGAGRQPPLTAATMPRPSAASTGSDEACPLNSYQKAKIRDALKHKVFSPFHMLKIKYELTISKGTVTRNFLGPFFAP